MKRKALKNNPLSKRPKNKNTFQNLKLDDEDMGMSEQSSESSSEEQYEKKPRLAKETKVRNLLPVKNKDKLMFRSEIIPDSDDDDGNQDENQRTVPQNNTLVQSYAIQQKSVNDLKRKVALICTSVIEEPEKNMPALKDLVSMLLNPTTKMEITEKKILCLSLLHVFMDVLPGYRIRTQQDEKDSKVSLKKETKKLLGYEQSLLKSYQKYIEYLYLLIKRIKCLNDIDHSNSKDRVIYEVGIIALKCMCELLSTRFSFNYFKNIANKLVPLAFDGKESVMRMCCQSFKKLFKADKLGEASLNLVKQIVNLIKIRKFNVPVDVLQTFLSLNLREAKREVKKIDMNKGRKEWRMMSRSERKEKKKIKDLEAELKEAEAYESVDSIRKFHTATLNKIFWVFFHILKDAESSILIAPALEGLSKFAYLINLEFFDDLNSVLCSMMDTGRLSAVEKLHAVFTLFTLLAGQAESLHIDPHRIYCHMYQGLLNLSHSTGSEHFELVLKCLDFNIIRKRKRISPKRILAFTKRICTVCLQTPIHGTLGLLSSVKSVFNHVNHADILLDSESTLGSGLYLPEVEDPEHCNAQSSALWELHLLRKHYNPVITLYSLHLLNKCPKSGRLSLPEQLVQSNAEETLMLFSEIAKQNKLDFLEEAIVPPAKKFKHSETKLSYDDNVTLRVDDENLEKINFLPIKNKKMH